eukprot:TRINITY_DN9198_c0_g1_i1.p1 TRINITY_DN9198_c0_g1~~TRINITY_DN9198_c0_g1_i1.p1  ORF type:complete len:100 (-),score=4.65 TRINITY_DN9198_c0_g1_i1:227-526(-)
MTSSSRFRLWGSTKFAGAVMSLGVGAVVSLGVGAVVSLGAGAVMPVEGLGLGGWADDVMTVGGAAGSANAGVCSTPPNNGPEPVSGCCCEGLVSTMEVS